MSRTISVAICAAAVLLVTSVAGAEEGPSGGAASVPRAAEADAPACDAACDLEAAGTEVSAAGTPVAPDAGPDFEPLTDDELAVLEEAAARDPALEDKAGGYVSNEELLTILLVVIIVVIII